MLRPAGEALKKLGLLGLIGGAGAGGYALGERAVNPPQPPMYSGMVLNNEAQVEMLKRQAFQEMLMDNGIF